MCVCLCFSLCLSLFTLWPNLNSMQLKNKSAPIETKKSLDDKIYIRVKFMGHIDGGISKQTILLSLTMIFQRACLYVWLKLMMFSIWKYDWRLTVWVSFPIYFSFSKRSESASKLALNTQAFTSSNAESSVWERTMDKYMECLAFYAILWWLFTVLLSLSLAHAHSHRTQIQRWNACQVWEGRLLVFTVFDNYAVQITYLKIKINMAAIPHNQPLYNVL